MPRIPYDARLTMLDAHIGHWTEANTLAGGPVIITLNTTPSSTYALTDLQAGREAYQDKCDEILELDETTLPALRSERDDFFGLNAKDKDGIWFWLSQYKENVALHVGRRHALARTVPNLAVVTPAEYLKIIQRFIDHWERVNAAFAAPFVLGTLTLASLTTKHGLLEDKIEAVGKAEIALAVAREEREQMFGDVAEEARLDNSLITRLEQYHGTITLKFPGEPIANTLPRIFPEQDGPLPKFKFNWRDLGGGNLKTWLADPALEDVTTLYLKEGAVEQTKPFTPGVEDTVTAQTWTGITMVGELDVLELRDGDGKTVARGNRDVGLVEPA
jgi:hypothetical protein